MRKNSQVGFSLLELMVAVLIMMVIMGAVFSQLDLVQKRYRSEEVKLDIFQTAREFVDQMVRDLHQAGFPNGKMLAGPNGLNGHLPENTLNAVGIYYISDTEVDFQGDIDGDGIVDDVVYKLFPPSANPGDENCWCIRRSQVQKSALDANSIKIGQTPDFRTQVENIQIVNGQPIFAAYDKLGKPQPLGTSGLTKTVFDPHDDGSLDPINKIWAVQINLNVQAATADIGSARTRPHVFLTATAQVNN